MEITTETVTDQATYYLLKINAKKSTGLDDFSPKIIKLSTPSIASLLANLFNHYIRKSTPSVPSEWKMSNVTPIHKKGETTDKSNYRPVSALSTISKLFEKVMFDQLYTSFTPTFSSNMLVDLINRWLETSSRRKERSGCGCHRCIKGFRPFLP